MKKISVLFFGLTTILLASAMSAPGQEKPVILEKETVRTDSPVIQLQTQGPGGNTYTFVTSEFSFDRLVKGAPYSAQAVTETTQTLGDGNRIVNTSTASVYRDSEGRTRREQTLNPIGPFAPSGEHLKTISISDPVAGVGYMLDPENHVAHKNQAFRMEPGTVAGIRTQGGGGGGVSANFTLTRNPNGEVQMNNTGGEMKTKVRTRADKEGPDVRMEGLGTQSVEGVNAVGSRTTVTIPAGQIGNERPIEIVDERWFSEELQTVIMTRHTDPRAGETVYRLTNIIRAEPDHSLFEVPAGYSLKEEQPMRLRMQKPPNPEQ